MAHPGTSMHDGAPGELPIDPDRVIAETAANRQDPPQLPRAQRTILLVVASAGVVGALARYTMARLIRTPQGHFPWSTFWINITGSLVIGFVLVLLTERFPRARLARPLIATGFLGAYTTFSTYVVDTDLLLRGHDIATGVVYAISSLLAGGAATFAGVVLARHVVHLDHHLGEELSR